MSAYNTQLEASINLLEYSSGDVFTFFEPSKLHSTDGKISFSVLMNLKQPENCDDFMISVSLVYIPDESIEAEPNDDTNNKQRLLQLNLYKTKLSDLTEESATKYKKNKRLVIDIWATRNLIKLNFKNVPTNGPGSYAVVVSASQVDKPSEDKLFLDCYYVDVT